MARRLSRLALLLLATLLGCASVLLAPTPAWACSCAPLSQQQQYDDADAVFRGVVTASDRAGRGQSTRVELRFDVSRVFKGRVFSDQVVATPRDSAGCGIDAAVGSTWVIYANSSIEGSGDRAVTRLTTTACNGNLPGAATPSTLGRGTFPRPGSSDTEEKTVVADDRIDTGLKIAGFTLLGIVVLGGVGLLLIWRPGRPG